MDFDATVPNREDVLAEVVRFYLDSGDFNGLPVQRHDPRGRAFAELLSGGLIEITSYRAYPNPHIKPWSPRESGEQGRSLAESLAGEGLACAYPSPAAMSSVDLSHLADKPYQRDLASGHGALDVVYFDIAAIEPYRNDPRFWLDLNDFGASWGIGDEAWSDEDEPERDKIATVRAGFAFDRDELVAGTPTKRYICALMRDLWRLTPTHQHRLRTWEMEQPGRFTPHPTWWAMQMGHWPERIGLFDKVVAEIEAISQTWKIAFSEPLFRATERHRAWGWLIRASSTEWDEFVLLTDQLLSENLNTAALDAAGAPTTNAQGDRLGTINRLVEFFYLRTSVPKHQVDETFAPLKAIRKARQKPAHAAKAPTTDADAFVRQREVLTDLAKSLEALRRFLQRHPKVVSDGWKPNDYLDRWLTF
jgi:hypothetical protein